MARARTVHRCTSCGTSSPRWAGKCPTCDTWNSLVEVVEQVRTALPSGVLNHAVPITDIDGTDGSPISSGVAELDRVLGGGFVPGSVTVMGGEPGIGKSSLLLQVMAARAAAGETVLYMSGEESNRQVRSRAERLGVLSPNLHLLSETQLPSLINALDLLRPTCVVVDSIQTLEDPELSSGPGSVVQVREGAHRLVRETKARSLTTILVGHVTKDGDLAGPRLLEHIVDTVLAIEGDRHHALRLVRAVKHRFGPTSELGLFEMTALGMIGVPDPSGMFLADRALGVPGSAVVPTLDGQRPLLVEVQALVSTSHMPMPRRSSQGVDNNRLAMLLAVLEQRAGIVFSKHDVYVSAMGGARLTEPGSDLGVCLALASARLDRTSASDVLACAEVGLAGELRQVPQTPRRLAEAARLGFTAAIVPPTALTGVTGIKLFSAKTVTEALAWMGLGNSTGRNN